MPPSGLASWLACFGQPTSSQPKAHSRDHPRHAVTKELPPERAQAGTTAPETDPLGFHTVGPARARPEPHPQNAWSVSFNGTSYGGACKHVAPGEDRSSVQHAGASGERSSAPTEPTAERAAALRAAADTAAAGAVPKLSEPGAYVPTAAAAKAELPARAAAVAAAAVASWPSREQAPQAAAPAGRLPGEQPRTAQVSVEIEPQEEAGRISRWLAAQPAHGIPPPADEAPAASAYATAGGDGLQRKQRSKRVAEDGGGPRGGDEGESVPQDEALAAVLAAAERTDAWVASTLPSARHTASGGSDVRGGTAHQQPTAQHTSSKRLLSTRPSSNRVSGALAAEPAPAAAMAAAAPVLRISASGRHLQQQPQPQRQSTSGALNSAAATGGSSSSRRAPLTKGPSMRHDLLGLALTELHDILEAAPSAAPHPAHDAGADVGAAAAAAHHGNGRASDTGLSGSGARGAVSNDPHELGRAVLQVLHKMPSSRQAMDAAAAPAQANPVHKAHSSRAIASKAHSAKAMLAMTPSARDFAPHPSGGGAQPAAVPRRSTLGQRRHPSGLCWKTTTLDTTNRGLLDGEDAAAGRTLVRVMKRFSESGPEAAAQYVAGGGATSSAAAAPRIKDVAAQRCLQEGMLLSAALRLNSQRHPQEQVQHKQQSLQERPLRKTVSTRQH
eukprot:XP_001699089.1 predicted protein [Chlamydomonas reinhardtii]